MLKGRVGDGLNNYSNTGTIILDAEFSDRQQMFEQIKARLDRILGNQDFTSIQHEEYSGETNFSHEIDYSDFDSSQLDDGAINLYGNVLTNAYQHQRVGKTSFEFRFINVFLINSSSELIKISSGEIVEPSSANVEFKIDAFWDYDYEENLSVTISDNINIASNLSGDILTLNFSDSTIANIEITTSNQEFDFTVKYEKD